MGTILEFKRVAGGMQRSASDCGAGSDLSLQVMAGAEIIIFPGVRYERWEGDEPPEYAAMSGVDGDEADGVTEAHSDPLPERKPRRRASQGGASAARKRSARPQRRRDVLEIPD